MKTVIVKTAFAIAAMFSVGQASANCYTMNNEPCYPQQVVTIPGEVIVHRTIHTAPPPVVVQEAPIHTYVDVYEQPRQYIPPPQQYREINTVVQGEICPPAYMPPPVQNGCNGNYCENNPMDAYHVPGYNNRFAPKADFDRYGNDIPQTF